MGKLTPKGHYPNAAEKDVKYGSIIVVSSVASTYGGELADMFSVISLRARYEARPTSHDLETSVKNADLSAQDPT